MRPILILSGFVTAATAAQRTLVIKDADWASLNKTVHGRLRKAVPYAAACYRNYDQEPHQRNQTQCQYVEKNWRDERFLADQFSGSMNTNWATCQATGAACLVPDGKTTGSCQLGAIPSYYIEVQEVSDVQHGLAFAEHHAVPLVIKNTGHDYRGRSIEPHTLALWMHNVQPALQYHESFDVDGCASPAENVITMGAGQQFYGLYEFANSVGRDIVGGADPGVGTAGGWITGGGHSVLSPAHGLGVDNAIQFSAVLPNGTYLTANRCQNQDLFFALRGGGGGTFGVIMELAYRTLPQHPVQVAAYPNLQMNDESVREYVSLLVENGGRWAAEGWGGFWNLSAERTGAVQILVNPLLSHAEAARSLKPIDEFYAKIANRTGVLWQVDSFFKAYGVLSPSGPGGAGDRAGQSLSSRLTPRASHSDPKAKKQLVDAILQMMTDASMREDAQNWLMLTGLVAPSNYTLPREDEREGAGHAAVAPQWRDAVWHVLTGIQWPANMTSPSYVRDKFRASHRGMQPLRDITPSSGAYINEADVYEPNHEFAFWGDNYERLLQIKREVDPGNLLTGWQSVGWDAEDVRWGCYPRVL